MKRLALTICLFMSVAFASAQEFDTLYTRGGSNYILIPKESEDLKEIKQRDNTILNDIFTGLLVAAVLTIGGYFIKGLRKEIQVLAHEQKTTSNRLTVVEEVLQQTKLVVMDISLCNNIMSRIDFKVQTTLEVLDKDDVVTKGFIMKMAHLSKECIQWAIHTKLKVTKNEVQAQYELMNIEVRDLLKNMPEAFIKKVQPTLKAISEHHIERVIAISQDEIFNNHLGDFFTLTEQTVNETIRTIVRVRLDHKEK